MTSTFKVGDKVRIKGGYAEDVLEVICVHRHRGVEYVKAHHATKGVASLTAADFIPAT